MCPFPMPAGGAVRALPSLFLLLGIAAGADPAPGYVGAETCAKCHPAEFDLQSRSAHAHTLAPSAAGQPGDWAFGAGRQAITFVRREDQDHYRELGQTWYRELNGYGLTPGHRNPDGVAFRLFDPDARILRCFACHSPWAKAIASFPTNWACAARCATAPEASTRRIRREIARGIRAGSGQPG